MQFPLKYAKICKMYFIFFTLKNDEMKKFYKRFVINNSIKHLIDGTEVNTSCLYFFLREFNDLNYS